MGSTNPRPGNRLRDGDQADLSDDVRESIEQTTDDDFGDETQRNEKRTTEEGLEQTDFIDPRQEDDAGEDSEDG